MLLDRPAWWLSRRELCRWMAETETEQIIAATTHYRGRGFYASLAPLQSLPEITALVRRVQAAQPRVIVEIGTQLGGTLYMWCRTNPQAELIVSIDLPAGEFGGGYLPQRGKMYQTFVTDRPTTELALLRCNSHAPSTVTTLQRLLAGRPIDFLYIDGDHTYEGVRRDYELYAPLVRPGGLIAFHDINTHLDDHEVHRFWSELRDHEQIEEIIEAPKSARFGIGIVTCGRNTALTAQPQHFQRESQP